MEGNAEPVIADFIATARSAGWIFPSEEPAVGSDGYRSWYAEKKLDVGLAGLSITLGLPDAEEDWDLGVRLVFVEEYSEQQLLLNSRRHSSTRAGGAALVRFSIMGDCAPDWSIPCWLWRSDD